MNSHQECIKFINEETNNIAKLIKGKIGEIGIYQQ